MPLTFFQRAAHKKLKKKGSFCILTNYSNAKIFKGYPGYANGKLTSRAFWKCGSFCCYNFLNQSNGCSKSTESEILPMLAKIRGVKKKRHGYNFTFQVLPLNQHQNIPNGSTLIQYGCLKRKIVAVSFFFTPLFWGGYNFWAITLQRIVQMTWFFGFPPKIKIYDHLIFLKNWFWPTFSAFAFA